MANKEYLDAEGVKRLKKYIDDQISFIWKAIDLLNSTDETPGSIQNMIDNAINNLRLDDLEQNDQLIINGGSASKEENKT